MKLNRKGDAAEISTFIILMGLFIILYVVLLPPGGEMLFSEKHQLQQAQEKLALEAGARYCFQNHQGRFLHTQRIYRH